MTIQQTIEIPASRRLTIETPREILAGKTIFAFTPKVSESEITGKLAALEQLNRQFQELNETDPLPPEFDAILAKRVRFSRGDTGA
ncbi:hypothetical protein FACS1894200_05950 [Spirochaetia bacterium]|nr:hypothetical protein FACS1894200_05950 [Spirochaetia bacterium]